MVPFCNDKAHSLAGYFSCMHRRANMFAMRNFSVFLELSVIIFPCLFILTSLGGFPCKFFKILISQTYPVGFILCNYGQFSSHETMAV